MTHENKVELEEDEVILIFTREDKFLLLIKLLMTGFVFSIPFILEEILIFYWPGFVVPPATDIWALIKDTYLLLALLGTYMMLALFHLNVHIVTNKRVIDSDQITITRHRISEAHLNRIQEVSADVNGLWGQILNYGNVSIQSAGEENKIVFENVPDPRKIKRIILDNHYTHVTT